MVVRQAISDGPVGFLGRSIAAAMASGSWPSMRVAAQPAASKRFTWSTESESESAPSMEMPLSSNSTISRLSLRWPASAIASWLMPSIRSPSEAST